MRARGIIVLENPTSWSKISRQNNFNWLKLDFNPFFAAIKPALSVWYASGSYGRAVGLTVMYA